MSNVRAAMAMLGVSFVDGDGYLKDKLRLSQEVSRAILNQPVGLRPIFADVLWPDEPPKTEEPHA